MRLEKSSGFLPIYGYKSGKLTHKKSAALIFNQPKFFIYSTTRKKALTQHSTLKPFGSR